MEFTRNRFTYPEEPNAGLVYLDNEFTITDKLQTSWPEVMSPDEKAGIFIPCIDHMRSIMHSKGYSLPDGVLDRLFIVDSDSFQTAVHEYQMPWLKGAVGISLPNRNSLINAEAVENLAKQPSKKELYYQIVGTHELWHTLDYREFWTKDIDTEIQVNEADLYKNQRRWGIYTARPDVPPVLGGLGALMEGFTEYRTRAVIRELYPTIDYSQYGSYLPQLELIDYLKMFFKTDQSLYDASFTRDGFRSLISNIRNHVGASMLKHI